MEDVTKRLDKVTRLKDSGNGINRDRFKDKRLTGVRLQVVEMKINNT